MLKSGLEHSSISCRDISTSCNLPEKAWSALMGDTLICPINCYKKRRIRGGAPLRPGSILSLTIFDKVIVEVIGCGSHIRGLCL
jgi:hypothetical protein